MSLEDRTRGRHRKQLPEKAWGRVSEAPWQFGQNSLTWALSVLTGAEAWTLASNLILRSTENSLLTLPLGPSEASNTDMLDKLRQAVSEGEVEGGQGDCCCVGPDSTSDLPSSLREGDGAVRAGAADAGGTAVPAPGSAAPPGAPWGGPMPSGIRRGATPSQHLWTPAASLCGHGGIFLLSAAPNWFCLEWDFAPTSSGGSSPHGTLALGSPSISELPLASNNSFLDLHL